MPDPSPYLSEDQVDPGLLRQLLGVLGTGASTVGNFLDTPGSIVRNILGGENPVKGLFNPEERTSAGDLLRKAGLIDPEDTWANLPARLATGIASDPLTYINPFAALTKLGGLTKVAGSAAEKAGLLHYLPQITDAPRTYLKGKTLTDLMGDIGKVQGAPMDKLRGALSDALTTAGVDSSSLADVMTQPLKKDIGMGIPFMHQPGVANLPGGDAIASTLDRIGSKMRWSKGGMLAASMFDAGNDAMTKEGQLAGQLTKLQEPGVTSGARGAIQPLEQWRIDHPNLSAADYGDLVESPANLKLDPFTNDPLAGAPAGAPSTIGTQATYGPHTYQQWNPISNDALNKMDEGTISDLMRQKKMVPTSDGGMAVAQGPVTNLISSSVMPLEERLKALATKTGYAPEDLRSGWQQYRNVDDPLVAAERAAGGNARPYQGDLAHATRHGVAEPEVVQGLDAGSAYQVQPGGPGGSPSNRVLAAKIGEQMQRQDALRNLPRSAVDTVLGDQGLRGMVANGRNPEEVAAETMARYGQQGTEVKGLLPEFTRTIGDGAEVLKPTGPLMADELGKMTPDMLKNGLFANDPLTDLRTRVQSSGTLQSRLNSLLNTLTKPGVLMDATDALRHSDTKSVSHVMDALNVNKDAFTKRMADALGIKPPEIPGANIFEKMAYTMSHRAEIDAAEQEYEAAMKALPNRQIATPIASDLERLVPKFKEPGYVETLLRKYVDPMTNLIKGSQTGPFLGFQFRNWGSEKLRSWSDIATSSEARSAMDAVLKGAPLTEGVVQKFADSPAFQTAAKGMGYAAIDENTLKPIVSRLMQAHEMSGMGEVSNVIGKQAGSATTMEHLKAEFPGGLPGAERTATTAETAKKAFQAYTGQLPGTTLNPPVIGDAFNWLRRKMGAKEDLPVGQMRGWQGATEPTFGPSVGGDIIGGAVYDKTRGESFLTKMLQGQSPEEAARQTLAAHVDYSGKAYTEFEKNVLGRMAPYYKFMKGNLQYTVNDLIHNPGGRTAQMIRTANEAQGKNLQPEYLTGQMAVPLGEDEAGNKRYLAGAGLMHEAALPFLAGPRSAGLGLLSALNPMLKGPLEGLTGRSFFQTDAMGEPRAVADQDPLLGRILANVSGRSEPVPTSGLLEGILSNSPASRILSTLRTLTDARKGVGGLPVPGPVSLLNTLTGAKVVDVSPAAREKQIHDAMSALMQGEGGRVYSDTYIPKEAIAAMPPEQQQAAAQLQALQRALGAVKRQRAKAASQ